MSESNWSIDGVPPQPSMESVVDPSPEIVDGGIFRVVLIKLIENGNGKGKDWKNGVVGEWKNKSGWGEVVILQRGYKMIVSIFLFYIYK